MYEEMIFAGFGGQGVILAGKLMCLAAMREGKKVSHIPSYGPEMRGGTANCSVVVADSDIASPVVYKPSIAVVMNGPSLEKFEPRIKPGGLLIYNSSLINKKPARTDIEVVAVEANKISEAHGSSRSANMAVLGKLLSLRPDLASIDSLIAAMDDAVSARNKKLNDINVKVVKAGSAA